MVETNTDFLGGVGVALPVSAEVDHRQIVAHFIRRITTIKRISQPELALIIEPPTFHIPIIEERRCVRIHFGWPWPCNWCQARRYRD